jgi:beta-glucosidase
VNNWFNQLPTTRTGQIALTAGQPVSIEVDYFQDGGGSQIALNWQIPGQDLLTPAVEAARAPDLAVVVVGKGEGEGADLSDIDLSGVQNQLVTAVAAAQPNTVVVVDTGSAVTMPWAGDVRGIIELSYTTFAYANLSVGPPAADGSVPVDFDLTDTGSWAGAEVAQVYVGQPAASGEPPRNLRGFRKVTLNPGQTTHVTLSLDARSFQTWSDGAWRTTAGTHTVAVGASSRDVRLTGTVALGGTTPTTVVSLCAHANSRLVTAENAGAAALIANRDAIGPWEQFDQLDAGGGAVALRAHADNRYVTAAQGASLIADATSVGAQQTFRLVHNPDGSVSLVAANGSYVCAENAGAAPLIANRAAIGPWEEFDLIRS